MKNFSKYKKADKEVEKHMKIIVKEIKKEVKDVVSVMAIGGLGRGEGSFIYENKKFKPLNDYDIYLITKKKTSFLKLKKISKRAGKKIMKSNFSFSRSSSLMEFYVDLRNMTLDEMKKVEPMLKYYEIRESAKIVYGRDVRKDMPNFSLDEIPLEEGFRFLMNRMSLLIESFNTGKLEDFKTRKTIIYYIGKNYLTAAESLLLLNKKFKASYEKRSKVLRKCYKEDFKKLAKKLPNLHLRVEKFTKNKLRPKRKFFKQDPKKLWLEARRDMLKVTNYYIEKAFNLNSSNFLQLSSEIKKMNKTFLKKYLSLFIKSKFNLNPKLLLSPLSFFGRIYFNYLYYKRNFLLNKKRNFKILFSSEDINLKIYSLCPLVLFSLKKDLSLNKECFNNARKKMNKISSSEKVNNWESLRKKYSDIFRVYQFLKG